MRVTLKTKRVYYDKWKSEFQFQRSSIYADISINAIYFRLAFVVE